MEDSPSRVNGIWEQTPCDGKCLVKSSCPSVGITFPFCSIEAWCVWFLQQAPLTLRNFGAHVIFHILLPLLKTIASSPNIFMYQSLIMGKWAGPCDHLVSVTRVRWKSLLLPISGSEVDSLWSLLGVDFFNLHSLKNRIKGGYIYICGRGLIKHEN